MTRKDYEAIAEAFRAAKDLTNQSETIKRINSYPNAGRLGAHAGIAFVEQRISDIFEAENKHFDPTRFAKACGR